MADKPELTRAMTPSQSGELAEDCLCKPHRCDYPNCPAGRDLTPFAVVQDEQPKLGPEAYAYAKKMGYSAADESTAPSPVGLPEEPKRYSFDGVHNVAPEYVKAYDYDALRTAAEQLRDENLEIKRAHLDEHLRANAAEQRVGEAHLKFTAEFMRAERSHERNKQLQRDLETKRVECDMLYESAGLMKRDLDAANLFIVDMMAAHTPTVAFQKRHAAAIALAHREPAGGEQV